MPLENNAARRLGFSPEEERLWLECCNLPPEGRTPRQNEVYSKVIRADAKRLGINLDKKRDAALRLRDRTLKKIRTLGAD